MPLITGLAYLVGLFALSAGLGMRLLTWSRARCSRMESLVLAPALGLGALQAVPFSLFATGLGTTPAFAFSLAALALVGLPHLVRFAQAAVQSARAVRKAAWWERAIAVTIVLLLITIFVRTVCPTVDGDALSYHLAAPKRYLQAGRFVFLPTITHTNWPLGTESLFATLLALDQTAPVAVVQFMLGLLALGGLWLLVIRVGGRAAAAAALVILLADNGFWQEMTMAYIDLGTVAFATLAVYMLCRGWKRGRVHASWWNLAAVFAGLAATTKLNGVWVIVALVIVIARTGRDPQRLRYAARFAVIAGAVASPWFLRTWALTGNPVYPALYGLFGGREWTSTGFARLHEFYLRLNVPPGMPPTPSVLLGSHAALAGLAALIAIVVFLCTRNSRYPAPPRFVAAFVALMCAFSILNLRFLMAALPSLAVSLSAPVRRVSPAWAVALVVLVAALSIRLGIRKLDPDLPTAAGIALGTSSAEDYLHQKVLDYEIVQFANRSLPRTARIAVSELAANTTLYDAATYSADYWLQDSIHYDSPERLDSDLRRLGITHLVIQVEYPEWCDRSHTCRYRNNIERKMLQGLVDRRGRRLKQSRSVALYELTGEASSGSPKGTP